jgi:hypothetical protein
MTDRLAPFTAIVYAYLKPNNIYMIFGFNISRRHLVPSSATVTETDSAALHALKSETNFQYYPGLFPAPAGQRRFTRQAKPLKRL